MRATLNSVRPTQRCCVAGGVRSRASAPCATRMPMRAMTGRMARGALQVVAFRDVHRCELLTATAQEFGTAWARGVVEGPSQTVLSSLSHMSDPFVSVSSSHPMGCSSHKGLDGLLEKLRVEHAAVSMGAMPKDVHGEEAAMAKAAGEREARVLLTAASDDGDVAFCLLQLPSADGGVAYSILKLDILLDDTVRRVTSVTERQALVSTPSLLASGEAAGLRGNPFPTHLLKPWALVGGTPDTGFTIQGHQGPVSEHKKPGHGNEGKQQAPTDQLRAAAEHAARVWCAARSSPKPKAAASAAAGTAAGIAATAGTAAGVAAGAACSADDGLESMLAKVVVSKEFKMYDAYGVLPLLCDPGVKAKSDAERTGTPSVHQAGSSSPGVRRHSPQECVVTFPQTVDIIRSMHSVYSVECECIDTAVSCEFAAGFTHWRSHMVNLTSCNSFTVEGLEVDLYEPTSGKLSAIYLYRDPMDFEENVLVEHAAVKAMGVDVGNTGQAKA